MYELFVFAILMQDQAVDKVAVASIDGDDEALRRLRAFSANEAHCFSQDDERRIRAIIGLDTKA